MLRAVASRPTAAYTLAQSGVPMILPSSGSSNATGQITFTTALPYQPTSPFALIYLPSGVVTAGSQGTSAGMYVVVFSSTTVCQVAGSGIVSANGAYTQTTATDLALATVTVPGGSMGLNGRLRPSSLWSVPNNANAKNAKVRLGGVAGTQHQNVSLASSTTGEILTVIANRGSASLQAGPNVQNQGYSLSGTAATYGTIDTSVDTTLVFQGNIATATDYMILENYGVEVLP